MARRLVRWTPWRWQLVARVAARAYVSGPALEDALGSARRLHRHGLSSTLCYWNGSGEAPLDIALRILALLAAARYEAAIASVALKLGPLAFDADLLTVILRAAAGSGVLLHIDSHGPEQAEQSLLVAERALPLYPLLGCTLPGRWRRSLDDAERAIALGLHVRVVKGQWPDTGVAADTPAQLRAGYLRVIDRLAGRAASVAVATHDAPLGEDALRRLRRAGTTCLLELLYGLPMRPLLDIARALEVPVRVYVPFGQGCLPYCLGYVRSNPRVVWWLLRDAVTGGSLLSLGRRG